MPEVGKVWPIPKQECIVVAWEEASTFQYGPDDGGVYPALVIIQQENVCKATGRLTRETMDWLEIEPSHLRELLPLLKRAIGLAESDTKRAQKELAHGEAQ